MNRRPEEYSELPAPPEWPRLLDALFELPRKSVLVYTVILLVLIGVLDAFFRANVSLGLLYAFPILLGSLSLKRWQMVALTLFCGLLREHLGPFRWEPFAVSRLVTFMLSFGGVGLLLNEVARNRRMSRRHYAELREQVAKRRETESQLATLVESTPAAILIIDGKGLVRMANRAAEELLEVEPESLVGAKVRDYLPTLAEIVEDTTESIPYRTATNCGGMKASGEHFRACVWFATYPTRDGIQLAAIVTDASEDLREFQETSLQNLLKSTRVLVGSVSHEIRNMCAAISVVHANLGRIHGVAASEDYAALGALAQALARLSTIELQQSGEAENAAVNLETLIEEFRIVVQPSLEGGEVRLVVEGFRGLPFATGNHHSLLQVMLNLSRNSLRAMEDRSGRLRVKAEASGDYLYIRVMDDGPGVKEPSKLFQAFQQGADAVGLGLFISRALVRSCGGELYYEPAPEGCTMCIRLRQWTGDETPGPLNISEIHA